MDRLGRHLVSALATGVVAVASFALKFFGSHKIPLHAFAGPMHPAKGAAATQVATIASFAKQFSGRVVTFCGVLPHAQFGTPLHAVLVAGFAHLVEG